MDPAGAAKLSRVGQCVAQSASVHPGGTGGRDGAEGQRERWEERAGLGVVEQGQVADVGGAGGFALGIVSNRVWEIETG